MRIHGVFNGTFFRLVIIKRTDGLFRFGWVAATVICDSDLASHGTINIAPIFPVLLFLLKFYHTTRSHTYIKNC